jgi:hypothetical protein
MSQFRAPRRALPTQTIAPPAVRSTAGDILGVFENLTGTISSTTNLLNQIAARSEEDQARIDFNDRQIGSLLAGRALPGILKSIEKGEADGLEGDDSDRVTALINASVPASASPQVRSQMHRQLSGQVAAGVVARQTIRENQADAQTRDLVRAGAVNIPVGDIDKYIEENAGQFHFPQNPRELKRDIHLSRLRSAGEHGTAAQFEKAAKEFRNEFPDDSDDAIRKEESIIRAEEVRLTESVLAEGRALITEMEKVDALDDVDVDTYLREKNIEPDTKAYNILKPSLEAIKRATGRRLKEQAAQQFQETLATIRREEGLILNEDRLRGESERFTNLTNQAFDAEVIRFQRRKDVRASRLTTTAVDMFLPVLEANPYEANAEAALDAAGFLPGERGREIARARLRSMQESAIAEDQRKNLEALSAESKQTAINMNAEAHLETMLTPGTTRYTNAPNVSITYATPNGLVTEKISQDQVGQMMLNKYEQRLKEEGLDDATVRARTLALATSKGYAWDKARNAVKGLSTGFGITSQTTEADLFTEVTDPEDPNKTVKVPTAYVQRVRFALQMRAMDQKGLTLNLNSDDNDLAFIRGVDAAWRRGESLESAILSTLRFTANSPTGGRSIPTVTDAQWNAVVDHISDDAILDSEWDRNSLRTIALGFIISSNGRTSNEKLGEDVARVIEEDYKVVNGNLVYKRGYAPGQDVEIVVGMLKDAYFAESNNPDPELNRNKVHVVFDKTTNTLSLVDETGSLVQNTLHMTSNQIDEFYRRYAWVEDRFAAEQSQRFTYMKAMRDGAKIVLDMGRSLRENSANAVLFGGQASPISKFRGREDLSEELAAIDARHKREFQVEPATEDQMIGPIRAIDVDRVRQKALNVTRLSKSEQQDRADEVMAGIMGR